LGREAYHVLIDFFRTCFALTLEDSAAQARSKIVMILQAIGAQTEPIVPAVESLLGFAEKSLSTTHWTPNSSSVNSSYDQRNLPVSMPTAPGPPGRGGLPMG
jgi:hypothetical protein